MRKLTYMLMQPFSTGGRYQHIEMQIVMMDQIDGAKMVANAIGTSNEEYQLKTLRAVKAMTGKGKFLECISPERGIRLSWQTGDESSDFSDWYACRINQMSLDNDENPKVLAKIRRAAIKAEKYFRFDNRSPAQIAHLLDSMGAVRVVDVPECMGVWVEDVEILPDCAYHKTHWDAIKEQEGNVSA